MSSFRSPNLLERRNIAATIKKMMQEKFRSKVRKHMIRKKAEAAEPRQQARQLADARRVRVLGLFAACVQRL
jgi:hypothetical protein